MEPKLLVTLSGEKIKSVCGTIEVNSLAPHACLLLRVKIIDQ